MRVTSCSERGTMLGDEPESSVAMVPGVDRQDMSQVHLQIRVASRQGAHILWRRVPGGMIA